MIYVNALADGFRRRNTSGLVSHWTNISCNRQYGSDSQSIEISEEKTLKKTTDRQKDFGPFPINSPGLERERPHLPLCQHQGAQHGETNGADPAGMLHQGDPGKDENHEDLLRLHEWQITTSTKKAWSKRQKRICSHKSLSILARQFSAGP